MIGDESQINAMSAFNCPVAPQDEIPNSGKNIKNHYSWLQVVDRALCSLGVHDITNA